MPLRYNLQCFTAMPRGIDKIDEVWPDHQLSIQNHFAQHLDPEDAKALQATTEKILNPKTE